MKSIRDFYYVFDKPVPYKGLLLYPIRVKQYHEFAFYSKCLTIEKNSLTDPQEAIKAISMTYLDYMYDAQYGEGENKYKYISLFDGLLRLVLNKSEDKDFLITYERKKENNAPIFTIRNMSKNPSYKEYVQYDSNDFMEIREIIAEQNSLDLPDEKIQKTVRDSLEKAKKFKQKLSKNKPASFEEQMVALSVYTGWELEKIYEMSYRKFIMAVLRANQIIMSNIYLNASMSGFVTFKDKSVLKGWIADISDEDRYGDVKMDSQELSNKATGSII